MNGASCLYTGEVMHARRRPVGHAFSLPLFMVYLDLAELPDVFDGRLLWSARRPALAWFRRADHFGDPALSLDEAVRRRVQEAIGRRPEGPIQLLTHLRYFGYVFNPISIYYCFTPDGEQVEALVAEVTNTPWGERHVYVVEPEPEPASDDGRLRARFAKAMHVSPFMTMDLEYRLSATIPRERLDLHMLAVKDEEPVFEAGLTLCRRPMTARALSGVLVRYPFMTARVVGTIYWQALRLRLKGLPFVPHPGRKATEPEHRSITEDRQRGTGPRIGG